MRLDVPLTSEIEKDLTELPDKVADALEVWRVATLDREKVESLLYAEFKATGEKRTAEEIKNMVRGHDNRYNASLKEIEAEVEYNRRYEKLLSAKKRASLRTAF